MEPLIVSLPPRASAPLRHSIVLMLRAPQSLEQGALGPLSVGIAVRARTKGKK